MHIKIQTSTPLTLHTKSDTEKNSALIQRKKEKKRVKKKKATFFPLPGRSYYEVNELFHEYSDKTKTLFFLFFFPPLNCFTF